MRETLGPGAIVWVIVSGFAVAACGSSSSGNPDGGGNGTGDGNTGPADALPSICEGVTCSGHGACFDVRGVATCQCDGGYTRSDPTTCVMATGPSLGGCPMLPPDHIFNTPIDALPVHANSDAFIATIGSTRRVHLDLGTTTDPQSTEFYGIPWNIVHGGSATWPEIQYYSPDTDNLGWDPRPEADCAIDAAHTFVQPCTADRAAHPTLPIPGNVVVEGGTSTAVDHQPYGDHHILLLDADTCTLWETYHSYLVAGGWQIFGSAAFDLTSNALRPDTWSSADAAGFPILPLLLRVDEANSGEIKHALRFTIDSNHIRIGYTWPARHLTENGTTSGNLPEMGQLFRLKASYVIPASANVQTRAILTALKTYGMYLADGGSAMYIQGEPDAGWLDDTFTKVQLVPASAFEAVDLAPIRARSGWSADSGRVP